MRVARSMSAALTRLDAVRLHLAAIGLRSPRSSKSEVRMTAHRDAHRAAPATLANRARVGSARVEAQAAELSRGPAARTSTADQVRHGVQRLASWSASLGVAGRFRW
jgi:hypothetical protein